MDDTACLSSSGLSSSDTPRRSVWKREEMSPEAEIVSTDAIFVLHRLRQCRVTCGRHQVMSSDMIRD